MTTAELTKQLEAMTVENEEVAGGTIAKRYGQFGKRVRVFDPRQKSPFARLLWALLGGFIRFAVHRFIREFLRHKYTHNQADSSAIVRLAYRPLLRSEH